MNLNRILRLLVIVGLVVLVWPVTPASAIDTRPCALTLYQDGYFGGAAVLVPKTTYFINLNLLYPNLDNRVSSWILSPYCHAKLATGYNGGGAWLDVWGNTRIAVTPRGWNDVISSVSVYRTDVLMKPGSG